MRMRGAISKRSSSQLPPLFSFVVPLHPVRHRIQPFLFTRGHPGGKGKSGTVVGQMRCATSVSVRSVLACSRRCMATASSSSPPPPPPPSSPSSSSSSASSSSSSSRPYRIVIPNFSSSASSGHASSASAFSRGDAFTPPPYTPPPSFTPHLHAEYAEARSPPPLSQLCSLLPPDVAEAHRRQVQASHEDWHQETLLERVWDGDHPHLRKQAQLIQRCGGDAMAAAEELVHPTQPSFREELERRPLDKAILEEIYMNLHGKRIERKLKKGVSWEHWITKGEGTAPVFTASRKAQQAFGMGGHVRWWASAREASQFPTLRIPKEGQVKKKYHTHVMKAKHTDTDATRNNEGHTNTANTVEEEVHEGSGVSRPSHTPHPSRGSFLPPRPPTPVSSASSSSLLLPPEFAFVGRTSSGKSALLNALLNAAVAPYGHLQGTTTAVNFYRVGGGGSGSGGGFTLVDCPGYGFFNPLQTPEVEAANAVKVMQAYLRQGGRWEPRKGWGWMEGMGHGSRAALHASSSTSQKDTTTKRKKKNRNRPGQEEPQGTSSSFFYPGVNMHFKSTPAGHGGGTLQGGRRRRIEDDTEEAEEEDHGVGGRTPGSAHHHHLRLRPLQRVFVCASSRGLQHLDWRYCDLLESIGVPFTVVLTKTDAAPIRFLARLTDYTRCRLVQYKCCKELLLTSALRLAGVDKMQNLIASMLPAPDGRRGGMGAGRREDDALDFSSVV